MFFDQPSSPLFCLWLTSLLATVGLGAATLVGIKLPESYCRLLVKGTTLLGLILALLSLLLQALPLGLETARVTIPWMRTSLLSMDVVLTADLYGWTYLAVAHVVLGAIGRFSAIYLENTQGYQKFMVLLLALQWGVISVITSDRFELLMMGWEVVGLGSVLLIGFIQDNRFSGSGSFTAFVSYKLGDIGLLIAGVMMHHLSPSGLISEIHHIPSEAPLLFVFGAAIILGSLAKGSQFPFVTWLPRAMEGPTPSSAAFYGALSVHLGPMLLIKLHQVWSWSPELSLFVGLIGVSTMAFGLSTGRTVANYKVQLAYGIMVQIGLIFVEIALGWYSLAMLHICGHAGLRTAQFLRSGSLLGDFGENPAFLALGSWGRRTRALVPSQALNQRIAYEKPSGSITWSKTLQHFHALAWNEFMVHRLGTDLLGAPSVGLSRWMHRLVGFPLIIGVLGMMVLGMMVILGLPTLPTLLILGLAALAAILSFEAPRLSQRFILVGCAHGLLLLVCQSMGLLSQSNLLVVNGVLTGLMVLAALGVVRDIETRAGFQVKSGQVKGLAMSFPHHGSAILAMSITLGIAPGSLLFMMEDVLLERILLYGPWAFAMVLILSVLLACSLYRSYTQFFMGYDRRWINPPPVKANIAVFWAMFLVLLSIILSVFPQGVL